MVSSWAETGQSRDDGPDAAAETLMIAARALRVQAVQKRKLDAKRRKALHRFDHLPKDASVPEITQWLTDEIWDLWEWWSGSGRLTICTERAGGKCGPPVTLETGWDITNPDHRRALKKLLVRHFVSVLWGAINCTPWTICSNGRDPEETLDMQRRAEPTLDFWEECTTIQEKRKASS